MIMTTVRMDSTHNFSKAKRLWKDPLTRYVAKKNIVHCLRYLEYGNQLIYTGKIYDFTAGNQYWKAVFEKESDNWKDFETEFWPHVKELTDKLQARLPIIEMEFVANQSQTVQYLQKYGAAQLERVRHILVDNAHLRNSQ